MISGVSSKVGGVSFPTWTEYKGQDDIRWYEGINLGNGTWKVTIPFSNHNYEMGVYFTHIYSYDHMGNHVGIGSTITEVGAEISQPGEVDMFQNHYEIYAYDIPHAIQKIRFPTWVDGREGTVWYEGQNLGNGTWKAVIPLQDYNFSTGTYYTHVYAYYDINGEGMIIGATSASVVSRVHVSIPGDTELSKDSYDIYARGLPPNMNKVLFPTWTEANGQDDILWHEGMHLGNGIWKATIPFNQHNNQIGYYNVHIYGYTTNNDSIFVGARTTYVYDDIRTHYRYDNQGLLTLVRSPSQTIQFSYDLNGNLLKRTSFLPSRGVIDEPIVVPDSDVSIIRGWILDDSGIAEVNIYVDGIWKGRAVYGDLREDVYQVYPQYNNQQSGFHFNLNTLGLPNGAHTITVQGIGQNGLEICLTRKLSDLLK